MGKKHRVPSYEIKATVIFAIERNQANKETLKEDLKGEAISVKSGAYQNLLWGHIIEVIEVNDAEMEYEEQ